MKREEFFETMSRLFDLSEQEVAELIAKRNFKKSEKLRLVAILEAVGDKLELCSKLTTTEQKRRVGKMLLTDVDYSRFDFEPIKSERFENYDQLERESFSSALTASKTYREEVGTKERLQRLFSDIYDRGINVYKTMIKSVLYDGNVRTIRGKDNEIVKKEVVLSRTDPRNFSRLFDCLFDSLNLTGNANKVQTSDVVKIFEQCPSLISKVNANAFYYVSWCLINDVVLVGRHGERMLVLRDCANEILMKNPTLFTANPVQILDAFEYLSKKLVPVWLKEYRVGNYPEKTEFAFVVDQMKKCLKENSSLLTIEKNVMVNKELLLKEVDAKFDNQYRDIFANYFKNPRNIAVLSRMKYRDLVENCEKNIKFLQSLSTSEMMKKCLEQNPYILCVDHEVLKELIREILVLDKKDPSKNYFDKFLMLGKSLFDGSKFNSKTILEKLQKIKLIALEEFSSSKECWELFKKLFLFDNQNLATKVEDLVSTKKRPVSQKRKMLAEEIVCVGKQFERLPQILKDERISSCNKNDLILQLATDVREIQNRRLKFAGTTENFVRSVEKSDDVYVCHILAQVLEVYKKRHDAVLAKYPQAEEIFERGFCDYVGNTFPEELPVCDVFDTEIFYRFNDAIASVYQTEEQTALCGGKIKVKNVPKDIEKKFGKFKQRNQSIWSGLQHFCA